MSFNTGSLNTMGTGNAFMGFEVGFANTVGSYNAFMGYVAGISSTTGYRSSHGCQGQLFQPNRP